MQLGQLITIEGTEGAGKTTALQFIKTYLAQQSIETIITREPGGTPLAEEIRKLILHAKQVEEMCPETELLMMFAARAQHLQKFILPHLQDGKWVVSDRYIDASYAYQGGGRGIDNQYISMLDQWIVGPSYPNLTILLNIQPEQGFVRTAIRGNEKDRIEKEQINFFQRVQESYLQRAKVDPSRIKVVDASQSFSEVEEQIRDILNYFIKSYL